MKHTDKSFVEESLAYFKRNYGEENVKQLTPNFYLQRAIEDSGIKVAEKKVLEIGAGGGGNLNWLHLEKHCKCWGLEPSPQVVESLKGKFPNIEFLSGTGDALPFESDRFDLVILRSVLHWIDRNYILQSLGEALRVTKKWLLISDFCPMVPFRTEYVHNAGLYTWHIDYTQIMQSSGIAEVLFEQYGGIRKTQEGIKGVILSSSELENPELDWDRVKTTIFRKSLELIPVKRPQDFLRG